MNRTRARLLAGVVAGLLVSGTAVAQAPATPPTATRAPAAATPSTATRVETWTRKQWEAAKKEWAKDKTKWADCRSQSSKQKLTGRKSWSFLYTCMTS